MSVASAPEQSKPSEPGLMDSLRLVGGNMRGVSGRMVLSLIAASLSVGFELVPVWLIYDLLQMLVAGVATAADFYRYGAILLVVIPAGYLLFGFATTQSHIVAFRKIHDLRERLARHLTKLPLGYFSRSRSGEIRRLMVDEPERLELILAHAIPEGFSAFLAWIVVSGWLIWMDWRMALAAIVITPLSFLFMGLAIRQAMSAMQDYQAANVHMNGAIGEFLAGITAIKIFHHAGRTQVAAQEAIQNFTNKQKKMGRKWVPLGGTFYALVTANLTVIVPVGVWFYAHGSLGLTELLFFIVLGGNYAAPLMRLFSLFQQFAHISYAASLIQDVLNERPQPDTGACLPLGARDVVFEDVTFGYGQTPAIRNVSFSARAGEMTALVGPSGSGKSTIAHLVARFYDIQSGRITIGGQDITQMSRAQHMENVAFVFQDSFLFTGTVAENLRMARPDATEAQLADAAQSAQAHEFITKLSSGYETLVGDGGTPLSGGEKQRLTLARAILKDAPIIVLDEATAFTDPDSEAEIQKAISALTKDKTVIVVAHRLHTIARASQILVLEGGSIVERGDHDSLREAGGLYHRMWTDYMAVREGGLRRDSTPKEIE